MRKFFVSALVACVLLAGSHARANLPFIPAQCMLEVPGVSLARIPNQSLLQWVVNYSCYQPVGGYRGCSWYYDLDVYRNGSYYFGVTADLWSACGSSGVHINAATTKSWPAGTYHAVIDVYQGSSYDPANAMWMGYDADNWVQ